MVVGPYMVLEYCQNGQLRDWLLQQKNKSTEETVELLYRISYGISKGMYYLEIKKVIDINFIFVNANAFDVLRYTSCNQDLLKKKPQGFQYCIQLLHRRLAARNVLLNVELEPKISGFGPEPPQPQNNERDGDAEEKVSSTFIKI